MRFIITAAIVALSAQVAAAQPPEPVRPGQAAVRTAVACADAPAWAAPTVSLRVVGVEDTQARFAFAPGDSVVLSTGRAGGVAPGQRYVIRRALRGPTRQPISQAAPGSIRTAGWLTVTAVNEGIALARIDRACDAVHPDDYLERYETTAASAAGQAGAPARDDVTPDSQPAVTAEQPAAAVASGMPQHDRMARAMFGADQSTLFGATSVFAIDRGAEDGIAPGQAFVVYRDTQTGRPLVIVGEAIALSVGPVSSTVVMERARYEVQAGDYLAPRAP